MNSWRIDVARADCRALSGLVVVLHLATALVPWFAGCETWLCLVLSALCLGVLPDALRAVPGRRCPIRDLRYAAGVLMVAARAGEALPAAVAASTRVLPDIVLGRFEVDGQMLDLWAPRYAFPATEFRRLKVALRCARPAGPG